MKFLDIPQAVEFSYSKKDRHVYRIPSDFSISEGEKVCLIGKSGSGKSTILTLLAGLRRFARGEIRYRFGGNAEFHLSARKWDAGPKLWGHIGFGFQRPELVNALSAIGNMRLSLGGGVGEVGSYLFPETAREVNGTTERANEWDEIRHKRTTALSGGQRLRLGLGRAFGAGQSIVILDEPTGALDADNRNMVAEFVKAQARHRGLLIVSHDEPFIEMLDVDRKYVMTQLQEDSRPGNPIVRTMMAIAGGAARQTSLHASATAGAQSCHPAAPPLSLDGRIAADISGVR